MYNWLQKCYDSFTSTLGTKIFPPDDLYRRAQSELIYAFWKLKFIISYADSIINEAKS